MSAFCLIKIFEGVQGKLFIKNCSCNYFDNLILFQGFNFFFDAFDALVGIGRCFSIGEG